MISKGVELLEWTGRDLAQGNIDVNGWKDRLPSASGHDGNYGVREIVNAILCQARTGCQWRCLPDVGWARR